MKYSLEVPVFFVGQTVRFNSYPKKTRVKQPTKKTGLIMQVKTVYYLIKKERIVKGAHLYNIKAIGQNRWVKESDILGVISKQ